MPIKYNVSASMTELSMDGWYFYSDQSEANAAAVAGAGDLGTTHYVHQVEYAPVFRADVVKSVTTEVM